MKQFTNKDVYFLGDNNDGIKKNRTWLFMILSIVLLTILIVLLIYTRSPKEKNVIENIQHNELQTIDVLPDNAKAPLFMGKYPMSDFLSWISQKVKYPKGKELQDAMVIVSFVITTDGKLDSIKILSQPEDKRFGLQVIKVLQECPNWKPGQLANGESTDIKYTLPVKFSRTRKFN